MSLKGLNVTHLVSRTACWVVIAGPHLGTAPPPRASRWSTAWRTPRTCGRSDRHQTEDGMNLETMNVYVWDDWRTDGPPVGADEDDLKLLTRLFDGPVRFHQDACQTATRRALVEEKDGSDEICCRQDEVRCFHWCFWSLEGPSVDLCILLLRLLFLPEPQQFEPCSFVSLLPSWLSSKRIGGGLDSTLIHQISQ